MSGPFNKFPMKYCHTKNVKATFFITTFIKA